MSFFFLHKTQIRVGSILNSHLFKLCFLQFVIWLCPHKMHTLLGQLPLETFQFLSFQITKCSSFQHVNAFFKFIFFVIKKKRKIILRFLPIVERCCSFCGCGGGGVKKSLKWNTTYCQFKKNLDKQFRSRKLYGTRP